MGDEVQEAEHRAQRSPDALDEAFAFRKIHTDSDNHLTLGVTPKLMMGIFRDLGIFKKYERGGDPATELGDNYEDLHWVKEEEYGYLCGYDICDVVKTFLNHHKYT